MTHIFRPVVLASIASVAIAGQLIITPSAIAQQQASPVNISELQKSQQDSFNDNIQQLDKNQSLIDSLTVEQRDLAKSDVQDGIKLALKGARVVGNTVISDEAITAIVLPYINRSVSGAELKNIAEQITQLYVEKGFITSRCIIPKQDVKGGVVQFYVEEDKLNDLFLAGDTSFKYESRLFYQYIYDLKGKVIHAPTLLERLRLMTFMPNTRITPSLRKSGVGLTDLILALQEPDETFAVTAQTNASRLYGEQRLTMNKRMNNITGQGDSLSFGMSFNPIQMKYFSSMQAQYTMPLGDKGGSIQLNFNTIDYQIDPDGLSSNQNANNVILYSGNSDIFSSRYQQPFWLDKGNYLWFVGIENRRSSSLSQLNFDPVTGQRLSDQKESVFAFRSGVNASYQDTWLFDQPAASRVELSLLRSLEGFMGGLTQEDIDIALAKTTQPNTIDEGAIGDKRGMRADFWKGYLQFSRNQSLGGDWRVSTTLNMEYTPQKNIPQSFQYGGANSGAYGYDLDIGFDYTGLSSWVFRLGYDEKRAYSYFIPRGPEDEFVASCGGLDNLDAYDYYHCRVSSPYLSVQARLSKWFFMAKYRETVRAFELQPDELTLMMSYRF